MKYQLGHGLKSSSVDETAASKASATCDLFDSQRYPANYDTTGASASAIQRNTEKIQDDLRDRCIETTPSITSAIEEEFDDDYCVLNETDPEIRITEKGETWHPTSDDPLLSVCVQQRRANTESLVCDNLATTLRRCGASDGDPSLDLPEKHGTGADTVFSHPNPVQPFFEHSRRDFTSLSHAAPALLHRPASPVPRQLLDHLGTFQSRYELGSHLPSVPFAAEFLVPVPLSAVGGAETSESETAAAATDDEDDIVVIPEEVQRLPDGTVFRRRVVNTRLRTVVTRRVRKVGPDGHPVEYTLSEEFSPDEPSASPLPARKVRVIDRASSISPIDHDRLRLQQSGAVEDGGSSFLVPQRHQRLARSAAGDLCTERVPVRPSPAELTSHCDTAYLPPPPPTIVAGIYTDADRPGAPEIDVDEIACAKETLPDGRIVERRTLRTRQRRTVVKRIVLRSSQLPSTPHHPPSRDERLRDNADEAEERVADDLSSRS